MTADVRHGPLDGLVRPEQQRDRVVEKEGILLDDRGDRGVRGQAQHQIGADVTDVVAPARDVAPMPAVAVCGAEPHPDPGIPGDSPDPANQHHGTEQAPVLAEPRREVRDLDATAVAVMQAGHQYTRCEEGRYSSFLEFY